MMGMRKKQLNLSSTLCTKWSRMPAGEAGQAGEGRQGLVRGGRVQMLARTNPQPHPQAHPRRSGRPRRPQSPRSSSPACGSTACSPGSRLWRRCSRPPAEVKQPRGRGSVRPGKAAGCVFTVSLPRAVLALALSTDQPNAGSTACQGSRNGSSRGAALTPLPCALLPPPLPCWLLPGAVTCGRVGCRAVEMRLPAGTHLPPYALAASRSPPPCHHHTIITHSTPALLWPAPPPHLGQHGLE